MCLGVAESVRFARPHVSVICLRLCKSESALVLVSLARGSGVYVRTQLIPRRRLQQASLPAAPTAQSFALPACRNPRRSGISGAKGGGGAPSKMATLSGFARAAGPQARAAGGFAP